MATVMNPVCMFNYFSHDYFVSLIVVMYFLIHAYRCSYLLCVYKSSLIYQCGKFISSRKNISELCVLIVNFCHVKKFTYSGINVI